MGSLYKLLSALLLAAGPGAAAGHDPVGAKVVTGVITGADYQTYRPIPFDVPKGVERITVKLEYDRSNKTVIDLGLWDPVRFRGWSGGTREAFTVSRSDASPGYLAGDLPPGRWEVMLGVPNVRPGSRSQYRVTINFDRGGGQGASDAISVPPIDSRPGWYRGDLHMHDAHSDGSCNSQRGKRVPCPLFRTVQAAAESGLDFIAVTDHNTVSHFGALRELQPYFDKLLLLPGVEITTFRGHANIFGARRFVDFRLGSPSVPSIRDLERNVAAAGAIMSINHPALPSGELCMGCGWTWKDTEWRGVTAVEAVNGTTSEGPLAGIPYWYARLNEGHRLTGIGGSDNHDADQPSGKPRIGRPTTVVHARELSQRGILDAIRNGDVFIDVDGSRDRLLEVEARSGNLTAVMGQTLSSGDPLTVRVHAIGVGDAIAELVLNGKVVSTKPLDASDSQFEFGLSGRPCGWIAANVRSLAGHYLLIGNPIYLRCR